MSISTLVLANRFSTFPISHVNMNTFEILKKKCVHEFIHLAIKQIGGRLCPSAALRPWTPHGFGLRILASLASVNGIFRKNLFSLLDTSVTSSKSTNYKIDHVPKTKSRTKKTHELKNNF